MATKRNEFFLLFTRRMWMGLTLLLFYTIFLTVSVAVISLMSDHDQSGPIKMLPSPSYRQLMAPKKGVKMYDSSDLGIVHVGRKYHSRGRENIPRVYTFTDGSWTMSDVCQPYRSYLQDPSFFLATLSSQAGSLKMFVHNPKYDAISGTIKDRQSFETENLDFVVSMLRKDPALSLIDIGANVGMYTMAAALLGRQVLAIDAVKENIEHVCASVEYQNFTNYVALVYNAVSDTNDKVALRQGGQGDYGLSHVDADDISLQMDSKFQKYFERDMIVEANAVKLDDILKLPRLTFFKHILLKIDVEGYEHRVLLGAKEFIKKRIDSIAGIIMEWQWFSGRQAEKIILDLMSAWNFTPYRFLLNLDMLSTNNTEKWPKDVLWLPNINKTNFKIKELNTPKPKYRSHDFA